jgi:methylenetetrahydrofolate dehydrogenase (NADP+)/methenyltetrahydrofolate cyclohydrolase
MLKPGAVVVDVGINVVDGHVVGDVDFASAVGVASAITPVPGGVGPLTNALLLTHLIRAAERQAATRRGLDATRQTASSHVPTATTAAPRGDR